LRVHRTFDGSDLRLIRVFLAVVTFGRGACTHDLALPLDDGTRLQVVERLGANYSERMLDPASEDYRAIHAWLEDNRGGWQQYYAFPRRGFDANP
jgi:hypothetical protein